MSVTADQQGAALSRPGGTFWDRRSMRTKRLVWVWSFLALPILFYSVIRFYPTIEAF
jgi:multiple sugar transport system permease protein